jgi:hypothetical protein
VSSYPITGQNRIQDIPVRPTSHKGENMKKLIQVSLMLVLAIALLVGHFQVGLGSDLSPTADSCRVGWNTRAGSCVLEVSTPKVPAIQPNSVGWNG